ncbi:hypothetical protein QVD17_03677 [Tagetes erecta]|uniref:Uncharacterized protein n=1 Tax=Tagetes erecta TaxID=13708 RepID=A0AAD8LG65_TARER|nr:hypothetical protein QVD17_03677 [Tagetes erecta]
MGLWLNPWPPYQTWPTWVHWTAFGFSASNTKLTEYFHSEAVRFLERVQKVVHSNSQSPRNQGFVFSRIGFAIQTGIAAQLVARLPIIRM